MTHITAADDHLAAALQAVQDLAWSIVRDHDGITDTTDHDGNHILTRGGERIAFCLDTAECETDEEGTPLDWGYTWTTYTADRDTNGDQIGWDSLDTGGSIHLGDLDTAVTEWAKQAAN